MARQHELVIETVAPVSTLRNWRRPAHAWRPKRHPERDEQDNPYQLDAPSASLNRLSNDLVMIQDWPAAFETPRWRVRTPCHSGRRQALREQH